GVSLVGVAGFEPATPSSRTRLSISRLLKIRQFSSRSATFVHVRLSYSGAGNGAGRTRRERPTDNRDGDDRSGSSVFRRSFQGSQQPPKDRCQLASTMSPPCAAVHAA